VNEPEIRAIALDVDGVLTDGGFWWGPDGQEFKRFSFLDVMGISRGTRAGLVFALISGEDSPLVDRLAQKLTIVHVFKGCKEKGRALREFAANVRLPLASIAFMGDDVNDFSAMEIAGLAAAPASAREEVRARVGFVASRPGGDGAVRELVEHVLNLGCRGAT
jgi:3-deoxy-D-manno-octulosonate 8-phosphate phosphatase (KDO 8-P phosphatase)